MKHKALRAILLGVLVFSLAVLSTGTMAQQPEGGEIESIACGDNVSCNRSGWAARISNSGGGGVFLAEQEAYTVGIKGSGRPGVYGSSGAGIGVKGTSINGAAVWGRSTNDVGVHGRSDNGTGVIAESTDGFGLEATSVYDDAISGSSWDESGVYGASLGADTADNGVYGLTESNHDSGEAGVRGVNQGFGPGVYGTGLADSDYAYGVRAASSHSHGLYSQGGAEAGDYGGYFTGFGGLRVDTTDVEPGYGLYVSTDEADGIYVESSNDRPLTAYALGPGWNGAFINSYDGYGVHGSTSYGTYGFHTWNAVYAGDGFVSPKSMLIAQNGDGEDLQAGDLVAVAGIAEAPTAYYGEPVLLVRKADPASPHGLLGVVEGRYVTELITREDVRLETRWVEVPDGEGGESDLLPVDDMIPVQEVVEHSKLLAEPARPGDRLLVVSRGITQARVDASGGAIQVGDRLAFGMALEPLAEGQGLIWVLVDLH